MDGLRQCIYCNMGYSRRPKEKPSQYNRRKYCSNKCKMKQLAKGWSTALYKREYPKIQNKCKQCGSLRDVAPCYSNRPFCNRKCMARYYDENKHGDGHWNWQGGITELRNRDNDTPEYKVWRKAVFKRDGYSCIKCGNKKSGTLRAHHILEYSTHPLYRYDVDNGRTLCEECHKELHYGIKQIQG